MTIPNQGGNSFEEYWANRDRWVAVIRAKGIKGAIYQKWVDNEAQTMQFNSTSLHFNDGLEMGDEMILGNWFSPCKLIKIVRAVDTDKFGGSTYGFEVLQENWELSHD